MQFTSNLQKTLEIYKRLYKAVSALMIQTKIEKIEFKKFLYSKNVPGFWSLKCLYK